MKKLATFTLCLCLATLVVLLFGCRTVENPQVKINPDGTVEVIDTKSGVTVTVPVWEPSK